jgi:hypothetical protein
MHDRRGDPARSGTSLFVGFHVKAFLRFRQRQVSSAQHDGSRCWSQG